MIMTFQTDMYEKLRLLADGMKGVKKTEEVVQ